MDLIEKMIEAAKDSNSIDAIAIEDDLLRMDVEKAKGILLEFKQNHNIKLYYEFAKLLPKKDIFKKILAHEKKQAHK